MTIETKVQFGIINAETGLTYDGYIDAEGKMKYRKPSRWERFKAFFRSPPRKTVFLGTLDVEFGFMFGKKVDDKASFYAAINPYTNSVYEIYGICNGKKQRYDINAFERDKVLVRIS